jgi:hypothetical protein
MSRSLSMPDESSVHDEGERQRKWVGASGWRCRILVGSRHDYPAKTGSRVFSASDKPSSLMDSVADRYNRAF